MRPGTILRSYVLGIGLLCLIGCENESADTWCRTSDRMELIVQYGEKWNEYNVAGNFDSVIVTTAPLFREALRDGDTLIAAWSGIFIAQAYMCMQELDSVGLYLEKLTPLVRNCTNTNIMITWCSTLGNYALRSSLDYEEAIKWYLQTLEWVEKGGSVINKIAVSYDIVYLFYLLEDKSGIEYAEDAYSVAQQLSRDSPQYCSAQVMLGMMKILTNDVDRASELLDSAGGIAFEHHYFSQMPDIDMFRGDILRKKMMFHSAIQSYERVVDCSGQVYPSTIIRSCLMLGECCYKAGMHRKALNYLATGLSVSYSTGVMEFRKDLLHSLYLYNYQLGEIDKAVKYYKAYMAFGDSIKNMANEQEFYALLREHKELEHENEMNLSIIALQKSRQRIMILLFIVIVVSIISVVFYVQRKRQRRMYMQLFDKHQKYLEYFNSQTVLREITKSSVNDADKELYVRIETLMRDEKVFKQKGLTRDSLAEMLGTNKTYVSRSINAFSGKTFVNYINAYRISEAVKMISAPGAAVNAKQLAEDLGYASVNVFYQVFQRETGLPLSRYRKELDDMRSHKKSQDEKE